MINRLATLFVRAAFLFLLLLTVSIAVFAQDEPLKINYRLGMTHPSSHLFEVRVEVERPADAMVDSLDFQMAKWSPGRYAVFDFAKNVQEFQAAAGICPPKSLCDQAMRPVTRVDDQTWRVPFMNSSGLTITYRVFANDLSGTFSELDSRHANFNGGCIFMYVVNHKQDPVRLEIDPPKGWRITNGRITKKDQREWQFPNWDILIDTPTEIAPDWTEDNFKVDGKNYHVVVHSLGPEGGKRRALVRDIEKIVKTETAMWGPPEFDSYTFLIHFSADDHSGDGMEHLTSTQIIMPGSLADAGAEAETIDAIAHEFFHVWNVKRLRPIELGPWDFTRPANTRGLWIAEGITNYYGHLMQRRAGLWDNAKLLSTFGAQITEVENAPGSRLMNAEESSLSAPFIDDAMRRMYEEFYLKSPNTTYYLRGRGYRPEDFERMVSQVAGADMSDFFKRYVRGVESPPYEEAFVQVGLHVVREPRQPVGVGITADESDHTNFKIASVRSGSPATEAGLQVGDIIKTFDGIRLTPGNFLSTIGRYRPGNHIELIIHRGPRSMQIMLTLGEPQILNYRTEEMKDAPVETKALRAAWLSGK